MDRNGISYALKSPQGRAAQYFRKIFFITTKLSLVSLLSKIGFSLDSILRVQVPWISSGSTCGTPKAVIYGLRGLFCFQ
jgi:hypothetical protein